MLDKSVFSARDNPSWKESLSMSFREKSAWASLAVMVVVYVPYFVRVSRLFGRGELKGGVLLGQFMSAVVFQVLLLIIVHIVIAIQSRQQQADERDRGIEATSYKIAYLALISSLFVALPSAISLVIALKPALASSLLALPFISQVLLLCFVMAETMKYCAQIVCYRWET
jgi:hypothetical protein